MLAISAIALQSCKTEEETRHVSGQAPSVGFDFTLTKTKGDGKIFPFYTIGHFTNSSSADAFSYVWNFSDGQTLQQYSREPVHQWATGGDHVVTLTVISPGGKNTLSKPVTTPDPCTDDTWKQLTNCGEAQWILSPAKGAIEMFIDTIGWVSYDQVKPLDCQVNDIFVFRANGSFYYDNAGDVGLSGGSANPVCTPKTDDLNALNGDTFNLDKTIDGHPKIVFPRDTSIRRGSWLGITDSVIGNSYEIVSINTNEMLVQGRLASPSLKGQGVRLKFINLTSPAAFNNLLNGGDSKTWLLDPDSTAKAIVVGTEGNPSEYYAGGKLATCQVDDEYTFFSNNTVSYDAKGSTYQPGTYICGPDNSYTPVAFTVENVENGLSGVKEIKLPADAKYFIGIKDRAPENTYRILKLTPAGMTLMSGTSTGGVRHTMKFVPKK